MQLRSTIRPYRNNFLPTCASQLRGFIIRKELLNRQCQNIQHTQKRTRKETWHLQISWTTFAHRRCSLSMEGENSLSCSPGSPTLIPGVILHYISAARKAFAIEPLMCQKQRFFKACEYESGAHQLRRENWKSVRVGLYKDLTSFCFHSFVHCIVSMMCLFCSTDFKYVFFVIVFHSDIFIIIGWYTVV